MTPVVTKRIIGLLYSAISLLSIFGAIETILARGFLFSELPLAQYSTHIAYITLIGLYIFWVFIRLAQHGRQFRPLIPDLFLSAILIAMVFPVHIGGSIVSFRILFSLITVFFRNTGIAALLNVIRLNPARLLLLSFFGGVMIGTLLLMLPAATTDHRGANFYDALFTSSSAICVTGLAVKDTGTYFTGFGQGIILMLVQVGGLGIMTFSTLYTILLGRRLGWRQEEHMREIMGISYRPPDVPSDYERHHHHSDF